MKRKLFLLLAASLALSTLTLGCGDNGNGGSGGNNGIPKREEGYPCLQENECKEGLSCTLGKEPIPIDIGGEIHVLGICTKLTTCTNNDSCTDPKKPVCVYSLAISGENALNKIRICAAGCSSDLDGCDELGGEVCAKQPDKLYTKCEKSCVNDNNCASDESCTDKFSISPSWKKVCIAKGKLADPSLNKICDYSTSPPTECLTGLGCQVDAPDEQIGFCSQPCTTEARDSSECGGNAPSCVQLWKATSATPPYERQGFCVSDHEYLQVMAMRHAANLKHEGDVCTNTNECDLNLVCVPDSKGATTGKCLNGCTNAGDCAATQTCTIHALEDALPPINLLEKMSPANPRYVTGLKLFSYSVCQ